MFQKRSGLLVSKSIQDLFNEAVELVNNDQFDRAITNLDDIVKLYPLLVNGLVQRGRAHWEMRRWEKALRDFQLALRMDPDSPDTKWTMGLMSLQLGDFEKGWDWYESRWESDAFKSPKLKTKLPRWEIDKGYQSVLVWCEQGIGDQTLYASLLNALSKITQKVTAMVDIRLMGMMQRAMPHIEFIRHDSRVKNMSFDSQIPIGSLGKAFIHSFDDIPVHRSERYLVADKEQSKLLFKQLSLKEEDFEVGISWASTAPRVGEHKSVPLHQFAPIFDIPNVKVVNLQYGKSKEAIAGFEQETGHCILQTTVNTFFDLEGVASMIRFCDVVVSCSNANVHIAGAMGKPVLLLDANKLWYWNSKDGNRSLWYPSVEIFNRESMVAPWDKQMDQVIHTLKEIAECKRTMTSLSLT